MKNLFFTFSSLLSIQLSAFGWPPSDQPDESTTINGRAMQVFHHGVQAEWGYAAPQQDAFVVVHPKNVRENAPVYVVLHSAGHDVFSCVNCTKTVGNHDIYRNLSSSGR